MIETKVYYVPLDEERVVVRSKKEERIIELAYFNLDEIYFGDKILGIDRVILESFKYNNYDA